MAGLIVCELELAFTVNIGHRPWFSFWLPSTPVVTVSGHDAGGRGQWMRQYAQQHA